MLISNILILLTGTSVYGMICKNKNYDEKSRLIGFITENSGS
jgi:hypothetical protein